VKTPRRDELIRDLTRVLDLLGTGLILWTIFAATYLTAWVLVNPQTPLEWIAITVAVSMGCYTMARAARNW